VFTPTALSGAELADRTVGREILIKRIVGSLRTAATSANRPHTLIVGPRGSGKTHVLAVVIHRATQEPAVRRRLAFVWVPEDPHEISSYEDLLLATVEHLLDGAAGEQQTKQAELDAARHYRRERDAAGLGEIVQRLLHGRVLVLVLENLDFLFAELGESGQRLLRGFMETEGNVLVLASTPLLFDAVTRRDGPWFESFTEEYLRELSVEDGSVLLRRVAEEAHDDDLARLLTTEAGQSRIHAVADLAGGSPRMWMVLASCMTMELLEELAALVYAMLDELSPYYQARLRELRPIERKLVLELCRTATLNRHGRVVQEQRVRRTVADLAAVCGVSEEVTTTALERLRDARWVLQSELDGTTFHEIREPLLRHHLQYRETRGEPLRVIVDFLCAWYAPQERRRRLADADPGSRTEQLLRQSFATELRASHALFGAASPEDLIFGARLLLDNEARDHDFGLRSASTGIMAEAIAIDALRGRGEALCACRYRLAAVEPPQRHVLAEVVATTLSAVGAPVSAADLTAHTPTGLAATPEAAPVSLASIRTRIADALYAATQADTGMPARDRVTMRLLAAGWLGGSVDTHRSCGLLEEAASLSSELGAKDIGLRLAVYGGLAYLFFGVGRHIEGRELCQWVVDERTQELGPDHPDTLRSRMDLAAFVGAANDPAAARDLCKAVSDDCERVLGADHPDTLAALHELAYYLCEAGDRTGARSLNAKVVADRERVLGSQHPDTLASRHERAYFLSESGDRRTTRDPSKARAADRRAARDLSKAVAEDLQAARDLFKAVAADRQRVLGAEHPDTLRSRHQHAYCVGALGDPLAASDLFAALAADRARVLGPTHQDTLRSRHEHIHHLGQAGKLDEAVTLAVDVLQESHRLRGPLEQYTRQSGETLSELIGGAEVAWQTVTGERALDPKVADALRLDSLLATWLLTAWCEATSRVNAGLTDAVSRVIQIAVRTERMTELGAAVIRALPRTADDRRARWIAEWIAEIAAYEKLAVAHRMLRAASAAFEGDSTELFALPAEEKRVIEQAIGYGGGSETTTRPH
jgi:hypothetical protein